MTVLGGVHRDNQFHCGGPFGKRLPDALQQGRKGDTFRGDGELFAFTSKQGQKPG